MARLAAFAGDYEFDALVLDDSGIRSVRELVIAACGSVMSTFAE